MPEPQPCPQADQRLLVARNDLTRSRWVSDPDAPAARALAEGEARLRIQQFALTANNITYAVFGETMKYWQFFPADDAEWGCIPVWGFAEVTGSRAPALAVGDRVYGFLPMGSYLVVQAEAASADSLVDTRAHRRELPAVYNRLQRVRAAAGQQPQREALRALLQPLFTTSFLIDDFMAGHGFFGASQIVLSSASSKTAWGTAFCLAQRRGQPGVPRVIGLTSAPHRDFVAGLGCFDEVLGYDALDTPGTLDAAAATVYIDFAGSAALRQHVHEHFGSRLAYSCSVGGAHWQALGGSRGLPGPRPVLFFAPAQWAGRSAPPPEGWGSEELQRRMGTAWQAFQAAVDAPGGAWLQVEHGQGPEALLAALTAQLQGRVAPRIGQMLAL